MPAKATQFQDLEVWKQAHALVLGIYGCSRAFPRDEAYGLTSQLRRAAVSVPANIAEGFKRLGRGDKVRFYNISEASLEEVKYYLILAQDLGYLGDNRTLMTQANDISRMLHGLIQSIGNRST